MHDDRYWMVMSPEEKNSKHRSLKELIERKKSLYDQKTRLYDELSRLKGDKESAYRRANATVTTAGPFGWFFGTTVNDKKAAFAETKWIKGEMNSTFNELTRVKSELKSVRLEIDMLKVQLFHDK